jgi:hypothetical protein
MVSAFSIANGDYPQIGARHEAGMPENPVRLPRLLFVSLLFFGTHLI